MSRWRVASLINLAQIRVAQPSAILQGLPDCRAFATCYLLAGQDLEVPPRTVCYTVVSRVTYPEELFSDIRAICDRYNCEKEGRRLWKLPLRDLKSSHSFRD